MDTKITKDFAGKATPITGGRHSIGAMGLGDEAVVDAKLRVHGIEGLLTADCGAAASVPNLLSSAYV
jgi:GMC oxidoreductase